MNIVFRVDATPSIGGGHVGRCLTLASKLRDMGHYCLFVMREHSDYLGRQVKYAGFPMVMLPYTDGHIVESNSYESWVGAPWEDDANQTYQVIVDYFINNINWIIVDHYGLDARWERLFIDRNIRVGVIDDLVNRPHCSEFVLDQTCGRTSLEYQSLVDDNTKLFVGEEYCLLREEFFLARNEAIKKRKSFDKIRRILVNFGSTDPCGHTLNTLKGLSGITFSQSVEVLVLIGSSCPFLQDIKQKIKDLPYRVTMHIDSNQVANLITNSDIGIGAAGATTWERCFLGLPTLLVKTAENQADVINRVVSSGAALGYFHSLEDPVKLNSALNELEKDYSKISDLALNMTIGDGVETLVSFFNEDGCDNE